MRFIVKLGVIFLVFWIIYLIPEKFLSLDFFRIKEIEVRGNNKNLLFELTELQEKLYNRNIWEIDTGKLKEEIKKDARVKSVEISNPKLGKLEIEVDEKEEMYYIQLKDRVYLADEIGEVFAYIKEKPPKDTYIIVAKEEDEVTTLLAIAKKIDTLNIKNIVSQIYMKNKNYVEILLINGIKIKTNLDVPIEKYIVFESLYNSISSEKKIEYVDLRFDDYIVKTIEEKKK